MSEIAIAHALALQSKVSMRFPSMLKNTLRTLVRGVFDTSKVGDLAYAVNKSVIYEGTTDEGSVNSNKHCPRYIRLYWIKIIE